MPPSRHSSSHHSSSSSSSRPSRPSSSSSRSSSSSSRGSSSRSSFGGSSSHSSFGGSSFRSDSSYRRPGNPRPPRNNYHSGPNYGLLWFLTRNRNQSTYNSTYSSNPSGTSYQNQTSNSGPVDTSVTCSCQYCGSSFHYSSPEEAPAVCPNCGGNLDVIKKASTATEQPYQSNYEPVSQPRKSSFSIVKIFILLAVLVMGLNVVWGIAASFLFFKDATDTMVTENSYDSANNSDEIYVEEIGRTCYWNEETETYYDSDTDCYFLLNDYIAPATWQYWYEGISSDFGDYGWMEYHEDERCWYIERSDSDWIRLPSKYDTSYLWYIKENRMP